MIYYLMIVSVVILYLLFRRRSKKYFIIGTWAILFLFQACRKYELWGDLIGYNKKHQSLGYYQNFSNLARMFLADSKDIGYYIAEWIAVRLGVSFQVWIVIIAFVFLSSVCILIYRKSIYPLISILTFISLGFFIFSLSGLRQTIAIAIVIWSYYFLEEKK